MGNPNSPNLNPLDYHIFGGGKAGVLTQAATEAKTSFRVLKCTLVSLVCLAAGSQATDNAVKDYRK